MARPKAYLSNADLLAEIVTCRETGKVSHRLAKMIMLLVERFSRRPNFIGYSYLSEMQADAIAQLAGNILKFNPERSSSAFGYATQIAKNSFIRRIKLEQRQQGIRDDLIIAGVGSHDGGYHAPSHSRVEDDLAAQRADDVVDDEADNPRAVIGGNHPPPGKRIKRKSRAAR